MLTSAQRAYLTVLTKIDRAELVRRISYIRATLGDGHVTLADLHRRLSAIDDVLSALDHEPVRVAHEHPQDRRDPYWVACYDAALQLTLSRHALPCGQVNWKAAQAAAKKSRLCGFKVWTCGTRQQWQSIIEDDRCGPALDPEFFTLAERFEWVWTATPCAPLGYAWNVYLSLGDSLRFRQSGVCRVRAVCSGQLSALGASA